MFFVSTAEWNSIVRMHHISNIHSSAGGHLGGFHFLAIVSQAAMNTDEHISLE